VGQGARLSRPRGHEQGEYSLFDTIEGAIELGVPYLSAYAFSTENWKRSPEEVRFLMGFNRDVIRRRRDQLVDLGVRVVWSGRPGRLWKSVISELQTAEEMSKDNKTLTLQFCVNYGGQAEIADAAAAIARDVAAGKLKADKVNEKTIAKYLYHPEIPRWTCSCARPASSARRTSCSGSRRTRNWSSSTPSGPTSTAATSGTRASSTPARPPASAAPSRTRWPPTAAVPDAARRVALSRGSALDGPGPRRPRRTGPAARCALRPRPARPCWSCRSPRRSRRASLASAAVTSCTVSPMTTVRTGARYFARAPFPAPAPPGVARTLSSVPYPPTSASNRVGQPERDATFAARHLRNVPDQRLHDQRIAAEPVQAAARPASGPPCSAKMVLIGAHLVRRSGEEPLRRAVGDAVRAKTSAQMSRSVRPPKTGVARQPRR
jgi:undecaprenyl diphosphate synthase